MTDQEILKKARDIIDKTIDNYIVKNNLVGQVPLTYEVKKMPGRPMKLHYDEKQDAMLCGLCFSGHHDLCQNLRRKCQCKREHKLWRKEN